MLKGILGILGIVGGFLGMFGGIIAVKFWALTLVVMTLLKLTGIVIMPWSGGLLTASAIGTALWMLFGGLVLILLGFLITAISTAVLDEV